LARLAAPLLRVIPPPLERLRVPIRFVSKLHYITNDPDFSAVFARDALGGGASVLVVHPALDPWTPAELSRPFFERIAAEKYWVDLQDCGHLPYEEPGVHQMTEAVSSFLTSRETKRAAGAPSTTS
jgi:pimeloyl-ACP methyl ester carboxylesterase